MDGLGLLVPVSRGIARAENPKSAAEKLRVELNEARTSALQMMAATPEGESKDNEEAPLKPFQSTFIKFALDATVLRFGTFTLKSGRISPYFFNAGLFNSGRLLLEVGDAYASALLERQELEYDVLFGPAYKGITLVSAVSMMLAKRGVNKDFAYNRKVRCWVGVGRVFVLCIHLICFLFFVFFFSICPQEKKDHGEGGVLVGADVKGKRVLIVDDVITAGTAIREAVKLLEAAGAIIAGVVIALDRAEIVSEEYKKSAIQSVQEEYSIPVVNIIALNHLLTYVGTDESLAEHVTSVEAYRNQYGTKV